MSPIGSNPVKPFPFGLGSAPPLLGAEAVITRPAVPFLPMTSTEKHQLGWEECDIIIVTGDAYVDHPSFGMAVIGRLLEASGFRVGILAQPDWTQVAPFRELGRPRLFFGVTAGNMDSMVNRYTSDHRLRHDDAYSPDGVGGKRPDRAAIVYAQRCREAFRDVPIVLGGIEASLRRIAHYDYWSEKVRRSVLVDSKADLLVYGNAERAIVQIANRLAAGQPVSSLRDIRGTAYVSNIPREGFEEVDSTSIDTPQELALPVNPYVDTTTLQTECSASLPSVTGAAGGDVALGALALTRKTRRSNWQKTVIRMPSYEAVACDPVLYAHASRILHMESNPGNARALVQRHGDRDVWLNPPPIPLTTPEMDTVYELPYARKPHPAYGAAKIPAYDMIRFSITIQRGCFGGCTFCSITEHEGRIIQNRSETSILKEIETVRDKVPGFTGVISDLGGPTANMYRLACRSPEIEAACRKPSCVYPGVCPNLNTDHSALVQLYRKARKVPGVKKILIASGVRYDLAIRDPDYVKELVSHHVGGRLKIAPEHVSEGPLSKMMKPPITNYDRFKELFEKYSREAGKKQHLIPYFIAAHPGTTDADMLELALWLKRNGFEADQVQTYLPSPMATATAMYHSGKNPLAKVTRTSEDVEIPRGLKVRRLHKAFLRYHDPKNWPILRQTLQRMGRSDLIGDREGCLVPAEHSGRSIGSRPKRSTTNRFKTQHIR
ncbi:MAG: YgiQ family radical SAM protein [Myxococcales bacterium]|nr:YgiQ family radical SAM protein [Myxococcales bacterium]